jgi:hydrogenase maturation protease
MKQRVVGVGSWSGGDDAVGLIVARRLRHLLDCEVLETDDPSQLVAWLDGCDRLVIVDGFWNPAAPGQVRSLREHDLAEQPLPLSSHGVSVQQALALGRAMGGERQCQDVHLVAVGIGETEPSAHELSDIVSRAVDIAVDRVVRLIEREPTTHA